MKYENSVVYTKQLAAATLRQEAQSSNLPNRATRRSKSLGDQTPSDANARPQQQLFQGHAISGADIYFPDRILRLPEVLAMVGIGRTTLLKLIADDAFPAPIHLSKRIRGWRLSAIQLFLASAEGK